MKANELKTDFPKTSETLVDKLQRGEAWDRFCRSYYGPIYAAFMKINVDRNGQIPESEVDDAIAWIFENLKFKFQGMNAKGETGKARFEYGKGHLRGWLKTFIGHAMHDYWKEEHGGRRVLPLLDQPDDDGSVREMSESESAFYDIGSDDWIVFLWRAAIKEALSFGKIRRGASQKIVNYIIRATEENRYADDASIASECKTTEANVRQVRKRFREDVEKCFSRYRIDDPDFFIEYAKSHGMDADADFALKHF